MANDDYRDDELKLPAPKDSTHADASHQLPWPEASDPHQLGEEFQHPERADEREIGKSFADPNTVDDKRIGKSFVETNSSHKKKKPPLAERVHKPANRRILWISLLIFALIFLLVLFVGWLPRHNKNKDNQKRAKEEKDKKPIVDVTKVQRESDQAGLVVPGTTIPLTEAYVYARANGYLKKRYVDIGDHVKKDQILAVIDAPDLDAQVEQARQQVKQAQQQLEQEKSQLALATVTVERYRVLVTKGVLSRQQGDQQEATFRSEQANVSADERNVEAFKANLQHQIALQSYEYVRAPFAGVITQRAVDVGALVSASGASGSASSAAPQGQSSSTGGSTQAGASNNGGSSGSGSSAATSSQAPGQGGPLFAVADVSRLRILVSVPEGYATAVQVGAKAQLAFQEYPSAQIFGQITRSAASIDANTRTMLTEVQVDNKDNKLIAGMYVVATFPPTPGAVTPILITGDAIAIRHDTSVVAVVANGKIHLQPIVLGRDFGVAVEVLGGLKEGDIVVTNVTDDVVEGVAVQTQFTQSGEQKPSAPPPQNTPPGGSSMYGDTGITDRNLQGRQSQQNKKATGAPAKKSNDSTSGSKP